MNATAEPTFDLSNFHGVGKAISGATTMDEALKQCGLNFTVSQHDFIVIGRDYHYNEFGEPIVDNYGCHQYSEINVERDQNDPKVLRVSHDSPYHGLKFPTLSPIVRDDTMEVISIMGSGYKIIQNHECVQTLAEILEESALEGKPLELFRGGVIKGCDFLYIAAKLPYDMEITDAQGNVTALHQYLVVQWSHTGAGKITLSFVTYEPVHKVFLYNGSKALDASIRHTKSAKNRLDEAKLYLKKMYNSFSNFGRQLQNLADKPMDQSRFEQFLEEVVFPVSEDNDETTAGGKRAATRVANKRESVSSLFGEIGGKTAYHGYLAICKHNDHDTTLKQKKEGRESIELKSENELRLFSSFKGSGVKAKQDAFTALTAL